MKTVIYLDVLLLINFLVGYLLCETVGFCFGLLASFWPKVAAGGVAALSSLCILCPPWPFWAQCVFRVGVGTAMVLTAFGWHGLRRLCAQTLALFLGNLILAGLAVFFSVQRGTAQTNNLACYFAVSPLLLTGCVAAVYAGLRLLGLIRPQQPKKLECCRVDLGGRILELHVYLDTGFLLRDPLGGLPILLVSWPQISESLPGEVRGFLAEWFGGTSPLPPGQLSFTPLPAKTATGSGLFPAFTVHSGQRREKLLLAFCDHKFGVEGADAIRGENFPAELCR